MKKRAEILVFGQVQGVFFRAFIQEKAMELGLTGWVGNEADGKVKILAEGEEEKLKQLVRYCQMGPEFAKVDKVDIKWNEAKEGFGDFKIKS